MEDGFLMTPDLALKITPDVFMASLRMLLKAHQASAAVTYFDRYSSNVLDHLTTPQRIQLDEIMNWADTVVEYEAARCEARDAQTASEAVGITNAVVA